MDRLILAIDPAHTETAYVLMDTNYKPLDIGKIPNDELMEKIRFWGFAPQFAHLKFEVAIEMVASYGMAVGKDVFETVFWIGRFYQEAIKQGFKADRVYRKEVKMNLCGQMKAKDSNIIQALIDRFAYGVPNRGKGYKKEPGFFYGFRADIHQAYAVGVTYLDRE